MTPKEIKKLIKKKNNHYTYYDNECEATVIFPKTWSLTKCCKFLIDFLKRNPQWKIMNKD